MTEVSLLCYICYAAIREEGSCVGDNEVCVCHSIRLALAEHGDNGIGVWLLLNDDGTLQEFFLDYRIILLFSGTVLLILTLYALTLYALLLLYL